MLATINRVLSEKRSTHRDVHKTLQEKFMRTDLAERVEGKVVSPPGFTGVFTRTGCLQLMRHLVVYGDRSVNGLVKPSTMRKIFDFLSKTRTDCQGRAVLR